MTPVPQVEGLHHIAVAVASIDEALPRWTGFGLTLQLVELVPTEQVRVAVLMAGSTRIELVEPTNPQSPVAQFLAKRGPGIHHLAFGVRDCRVHMDALAAAGVPLLSDGPKPGAHDCKIAFVHPRHLLGVLAELVEDPHAEAESA